MAASAASSTQLPLFASVELQNYQKNIRVKSPGISDGIPHLRRYDYRLALTIRPQVIQHFNTNRKGWLRRELVQLKADRQARARGYNAVIPAKHIAPKPHRTSRGIRVKGAYPRLTTVSPPHEAPGSNNGATVEPPSRVKASGRESNDFRSLPDYCPPLDSLPGRSNSLKIHWKGRPTDLSRDPYAGLLHPDEVLLASTLRLDCVTYLASKRRIFERRLHCLRMGKEFRKTDAQQVCHIDVNKASKLWTAFERVGWLDPRFVSPYLQTDKAHHEKQEPKSLPDIL